MINTLMSLIPIKIIIPIYTRNEVMTEESNLDSILF